MPSVLIACVNPELPVFAVESKSRKTRFLAHAAQKLGLDASPALAVFRTDGVKADLPAGKQLPFLYSTKDVPPAPPVGYTPTPPAEETPRASYELDPALIQLVGVLCLIGGCLGLVVYAILSIDE